MLSPRLWNNHLIPTRRRNLLCPRQNFLKCKSMNLWTIARHRRTENERCRRRSSPIGWSQSRAAFSNYRCEWRTIWSPCVKRLPMYVSPFCIWTETVMLCITSNGVLSFQGWKSAGSLVRIFPSDACWPSQRKYFRDTFDFARYTQNVRCKCFPQRALAYRDWPFGRANTPPY